ENEISAAFESLKNLQASGLLMRCPRRDRSAPETTGADEALGHPTLDLVGEAPAGETQVNGDVLLRPALPRSQQAAKQPAERTGPGAGVRRPVAGEIDGMGKNGHGRSPIYE